MMNPAVVLVFKTNITDSSQEICREVESLPEVDRCTLDLDDCEKIMRVESQSACSDLVLSTVRNLGFAIEEMAD